MTLKKSEKRMLMFLGIVVVGVVIFKLVDRPKAPKAAPNRPNTVQAQKPAQVSETAAQNEKDEIVKSKIDFSEEQYETWGRDPFTIVKPPPKKPKRRPPVKIDVVLKGIFWKEGRAYVLIDDYVLGEGDEEGGIRVEKIEGKSVICRKGGRQFTLQWREPS